MGTAAASRRLLIVLMVLCAGIAACSKDPARARREFLESGDRLVARKEFRQAIVQYRNALQQDPRSGEARLKLAETYLKAGDPQSGYRE